MTNINRSQTVALGRPRARRVGLAGSSKYNPLSSRYSILQKNADLKQKFYKRIMRELRAYDRRPKLVEEDAVLERKNILPVFPFAWIFDSFPLTNINVLEPGQTDFVCLDDYEGMYS